MASAAAVNLEEEFNPTDKPAGPCVMVVFGAAGDLTRRKLVPALFNLAKDKLLQDNFAVVGVSVDDLSGDSFRKESRNSWSRRTMIAMPGGGFASGCITNAVISAMKPRTPA